MNQYVKGGLIILASAFGAGAAMAATTHDIRAIVIAVVANVSATSIALLTQSPLPRKEWSDEERSEKLFPKPPEVAKPL